MPRNFPGVPFLLSAGNYFVNQTISQRFLCAHIMVALGIYFDNLQRLAGIGCQMLV